MHRSYASFLTSLVLFIIIYSEALRIMCITNYYSYLYYLLSAAIQLYNLTPNDYTNTKEFNSLMI